MPGFELSAAYMHIFQETRNLAEDETQVFQSRPASSCDASTGYHRGPGQTECDSREYYDGMPGGPAGAGLYETSYDILSLGLTVRWDRLFGGDSGPEIREELSVWSP